MTIKIINKHPTLKLRDCGDGWCEDASRKPGKGPRFRNTSRLKIHGGTIYGGMIYGGMIEGGVIEGGVIEGGTIYGGTIKGGAILCGRIRGGTIYDGTIYDGTIYDGVIMGGTFRCFLTAQRSDEYIFTVNDNGLKITAGCRYFTWDEAYGHWRSPDYPDPDLAAETIDILDFLHTQAKRHYPASFEVTA